MISKHNGEVTKKEEMSQVWEPENTWPYPLATTIVDIIGGVSAKRAKVEWTLKLNSL